MARILNIFEGAFLCFCTLALLTAIDVTKENKMLKEKINKLKNKD